ncbi:MAG TPA: class 1 fructose-bisphosphatase [Polyangiales bacterium]|nr:class 1 fructose-bisphosphatase [Polyangiales bacterium]
MVDEIRKAEHYGWTLERFLLERQREIPGATGEFTQLFQQLALAGKIISSRVNQAGLAGLLGHTGKTNIQGETVQKMDEFANRTLIHCIEAGGQVCLMASEEVDDPIPIPTRYPKGRYVLMFDPLDGSTNIDVNIAIGTIFSVHKRLSPGDDPGLADCLQTGTRQVAAGYIIYGSSCMFVFTSGQGVHGFTLDPSVGEFFLSHPDIRMPERGKLYSINEGNEGNWDPRVVEWVKWLKTPDKASGRPYSGRYIGTLVADMHRTLLKGGVFAYPADKKNPNGKLRLLYEASPMAMIATQAGGLASTGNQSVLEVVPTELHQRVPLYIGSKLDVQDAVARVGRG